MLHSGWAKFGLANIALASGLYVVKSSWDFAAYIFDVLIIIFMAWIVSLAMRRLVARIRALLPAIDQRLNIIGAQIDPMFSSIIEKITKKKFGNLSNPLLVSVRSGAKVSMPGMMDTVLNLGLNDKTVIALKNKTSNGRFAKDSYRRFIQMYSNVVLGIETHFFEELIDNYKLTKGGIQDIELNEKEKKNLFQHIK